MLKQRISGILMPIASLPAKDVGNFGKVAFQFLDQLVAAGQKIWQMLPIGPTITHDSPFYSPSAFAISFNYIALGDLVNNPNRNVLTQAELDEYIKKFDWENPNRINYGLLWEQKRPLLQKGYARFLEKDGIKNSAFVKFIEGQSLWLEDYAKFMGIKEIYLSDKDHDTWFKWPLEFKEKATFEKHYQEFMKIAEHNKHNSNVSSWKWSNVSDYWNLESVQRFQQIHYYAGFHKFLQWILMEQWQQLKAASQRKGIILIGDCPIYVAPDSADVWANQNVFKLDNQGNQSCYAGVPPDYFSPKYGQFWGNPIYKWYSNEETKEPNPITLEWWYKRLQHQFNLFDEVRIDHFRGFAGYWEIPADNCTDIDEKGVKVKTAKYGTWKPGPNLELFKYIAEKIGKKVTELPIIAEDLGVITEEVTKLRDSLQAPGMAVFQFAPWNHLHYEVWPGNYEYIKDVQKVKELPLHLRENWNRLYYWSENKFNALIKHEFLPENAQTSGKLVCYPGTHDNETLMGWFTSADRTPVEKAIFERYLDFHLNGDASDPLHWKVIKVLELSPEIRYTIFQMQDILGLPNVETVNELEIRIRMNIPNVEKQWMWKLAEGQFTQEIIQKLRQATQNGERC